MNLDKTYIGMLHTSFHAYAKVRLDVIHVSGEALHNAKRAIFDIHRAENAEAKKKIAAAQKLLAGLNKKHTAYPAMKEEGAYKAALEEFVEADLLWQFVTKGKMGKISSLRIPDEIYLAGLCDVPGELYRYAIRSASNGDTKIASACETAAAEIIGELIEFDLTKYLRTKFDQAKQAYQKLGIVMYELSLRK